MFINSIFLPKNISDQTPPEGVAGNIGNFSHLFSNVFRIVKDKQENSLPFKLVNLSSESIENPQNELLKVSLLSDNKVPLENTNISMIVAAFLSKLNPGEFTEELADVNKVKVNEKIPKYFSLSKNEFIKEIKNIIESLKKGDPKSLENVEILLIANGQSIKINPLTTNAVDLENWVTEQLQSNTDFEILVKNGQKKLAVDIQPIKIETVKTEKPADVISVVNDNHKNDEATTQSISRNSTHTTMVLNNSDLKKSSLQQPKIDSKPIIVVSENPTAANNIIMSEPEINKLDTADLEVSSKVKTGQLLKDTVSINSEVNQKLDINKTNTSNDVSVLKSGFKKEFIPKIQNEIIPELKASTQKNIVAIESNNLTSKNILSEYMVNSNIKTANVKTENNANNPEVDTLPKSNAELKQILEVKENELIQPGKPISFKTNQKITTVSINKNTIQDKAGLSDLIGKTDVKEIDISIQGNPKSTSTNTSKIKNEYQTELNSAKENITKSQTPVLNIDVKKVLSTNRELKRPVVKNTNEFENTKTEKSLGAISEKSVFPKIELNKASAINQQIAEENTGAISREKIEVENKNSGPIKASPVDLLKPKSEINVSETSKKISAPENNTDQKPTDLKSNPLKTFIENELVKSEKLVLPKIELNKTPANNQQAVKENAGTTSNEKIEIGNKNLESVKDSPVDSLKPKSETNVIDTSRKSLTPEIKTEQKPIEVKSNFHITEDETPKIQNKDSVKEVITNNIKESIKEGVTLKINTGTINKESEKTEVQSSNSSDMTLKNVKERLAVENLRTSLKETVNYKINPESVAKIQVENNNVKIDFMQRRIYSQIPPLEVMAAEAEVKQVKNSVLSVETNKNETTQHIDELVKSGQSTIEQKPKNEKQVWVKVSLEKNDNETVSEVRKSAHQQNKITIDESTDGMKKDFDQNNYSEKQSHEYQKSKPQNISVESNQNTEQKSTVQAQSSSNQDLVSNIKADLKTENNPFKSALHNEETKFTSRTAEMVEKIKVISSGEMVREISKVFESGEKQSIILRLVPKELGSIKVMLDTIDNVLTARVEVENETVGHIVRNNVEQLKQNLLQSGVHVNSINISYHNSDQKQHGFNNQKRKNSEHLPDNDLEEIDEAIVSKKMGYNTYEYLA